MNHWIEHDADGRILLAASCEMEPPAMYGGTVVAVAAEVDAGRALFLDGEVVDVGVAPSMLHVIDPATQSWRVPGKTPLQAAQDEKWTEMRTERDNRETGGFPHAGKVFDSDPVSVQRISGAAQAAQLALATSAPFAITWVCQDNSTIDLDAAGMVGVMVALVEYAGALHATARTLRTAIYDAAATLESVAAVAWPA
jgi:hypothetical protein